MPSNRNDGLSKRCEHPREQWAKCPDPWHFDFRYSRGAARRSRNGKATTRHRVSLHTYAGWPADKVMSKSEAKAFADKVRIEVREGTFGQSTGDARQDTRLTVDDVCNRYLDEHVRKPNRRPGAVRTMEYHIGLLCRTMVPAGGGTMIRFGEKVMADVTADDVDAVREARRRAYRETAENVEKTRQGAGDGGDAEKVNRKAIRIRPGVKQGEVGINRLLARLRHVFTWAMTRRPPSVHRTPFKQHGATLIHLETAAEKRRSRRLAAGEEERLLAHAGPHLKDLTIAALETGFRLGELLGLQWRDVRWIDRQGKPTMSALNLPAEKTKTAEPRSVPVTSRLAAVLEMRRTGPDGAELGPDAYVFGNEVGERIESTKTAWRATCRRAGIEDLHFHDLRREFASRLLESSATLAEVQACLGHANITMTSRYLGTTDAGLQRAFRNFEKARSGDSLATKWPHGDETTRSADTPASKTATENLPS
jgi:integrase